MNGTEPDRGSDWPDRTAIMAELGWDEVSLRAVDAIEPRELAALLREMPPHMVATFTGLIGMRGAAKISPALAGRIAERIRQSKSWDHISRLLMTVSPVFHEPFEWAPSHADTRVSELAAPLEARRRAVWSQALGSPVEDGSNSPLEDEDLTKVRAALESARNFLRRGPSLEPAVPLRPS